MLPRTPFLGCLQLQSPHFNSLPGTPPLPHLAIYCCNLLTSKMLHHRPHLGQGEFPGSSPPLGGAPWGQVLKGTSLHLTHHLFPPEPPAGLCPSHLQIPQEGWGVSVSFNWNWKRDRSCPLCPSRSGRDAGIALLYWTPLLPLITLN